MPRDASARVVIVDDEPDILSMVSEYLARDGHRVSACSSGVELDGIIASETPDLVILDVAMPDEDGISIARRLQAVGPTPIIMLTALDDIVDRIVGLEVGADDYVTKPFDLRELGARVRAVLRRARAASANHRALSAHAQEESRKNIICFGEAFLDFEGRCLRDRKGSQMPITAMEFDMLATFARHPNRVLSRERLLGSAPEHGGTSCDRAIDIRVTRIRKRIETNPTKPQVIRTVRSVGYVYVPPA
jgi:DNA-binding response OmpR family regulator